jgi:hypothetical protein
MKTSLLLLTLATALFLLPPAFAQHGHSGGAMGMSHNNGNASADHGNTNASSTQGKSVSQLLKQNPQLASKIKSLTGEDAQTACSGFKNLGQCVAAAHVAKNLNIPGGFTALKDKMLGISPNGTSTSTSKSMSLGKAIQTLEPSANAKAEISKAKKQADQDMKDSGTSS